MSKTLAEIKDELREIEHEMSNRLKIIELDNPEIIIHSVDICRNMPTADGRERIQDVQIDARMFQAKISRML